MRLHQPNGVTRHDRPIPLLHPGALRVGPPSTYSMVHVMVNSVYRYRGSDIPANGLSGSFFVKEEYANSLLQELESVDVMALMLEEREWAEHAGKGRTAKRIESAITEIHNELDAQRLRADTAEAELKNVRKSRSEELENYNALISELAAAEQRNAELAGLLSEAKAAVDDVAENCEDQTDWATANSMHALSERIDAALNQKSEGESHE